MSSTRRLVGSPATGHRNLIPALLLACLAGLTLPPNARSADAPALRPELARVLGPSQQSLQAGQAEQALAQALPGRAIPGLTAAERVWVERLVAAAALTAGRDAAALDALEYLGRSEFVPAAERVGFLESAVIAAQRLKDTARLADNAAAYLAAGGTNTAIRPAMLQAWATLGRHRELVAAVESLLKAGAGVAAPTERELRLLTASQKQLKDEAGIFRAQRALVSRFPSQDVWIDLISRVRKLPGFDNRLELELYDLFEEVGALDEPEDMAYMASLALKRGLPAQAHRLLEAGFAARTLGVGPEAAAHRAMHAEAQRRNAEDDRHLERLERSAASDAEFAELAEVLASRQRWREAAAAARSALASGKLAGAAQLRLLQGVCLLRSGQTEGARAAFQAVGDAGTAGLLAGLWLLRVPRT